MTRTPPAPAPARSETLDAVRAVALIGVLVINMLTISGLRLLESETVATLQGPVDRAVDLLLAIFVEGKALAAFSLLFGLSFWLLMDGAARRGEAFAPFFARRLLVLAGLGLLNAAAFYWGDILTTYAVLGAFLPFAALLSQRNLLRLALALLFLPPLLLALAGVVPPDPDATARAASLAPFAGAKLAATLEHNWALFTGAVGAPNPLRLWRYTNIGGLFLLGLYAGRAGLLPTLERNGAGLVAPALAALALGILLRAGVVSGLVAGPAATAALVAQPLMAFGYLVLLVRLFARPALASPRAALAPLGRIALTGYLMGGLLGQAVFYGWGLGWLGATGAATILAVALAVAAALALFAHAWLARFRFGPWEWLWRRLSRWSGPSMRLS